MPHEKQVWIQEQIKENPCWVRDPLDHPSADQAREMILAKYAAHVLSGKYQPNPPKRGPFGEAEIWIKPNSVPVGIRPYRMGGDRRDIHTNLIRDCVAKGKMTPGLSSWNLPSFPVQKANGKYRLVQDFRQLNAVTEKDAQPLPRIIDILHRQGQHQIWSKLDLVDGYHQMPLKVEHQPYTCSSTPLGVMQWTVLVMGLKNAGCQFQRMMEWSLRELPQVDPYLDDILIGSSGATPEELVANHLRDVLQVMARLHELSFVCSPEKSKFFQREVEFCGHILRDGLRSPSPGKLLPIQKWEVPTTVTALRSFLGLANYFSEYVEHYAETAAPLMAKLKLNREEGKKGSKVTVVMGPVELEAFEALKRKLAQSLSLHQPLLDKPFVLRTDASDTAIGAQLMQEIGGKLRTVALYSRKLTGSQLNWAVKEKEMYAVIAALNKWSGIINFQPVLVQTDHRALEHWVTENVETPSGPRGRRGRWHEILSQFDLTIEYLPGTENLVADAMSRWAYPASSSRQDVSWHGTKEAKEEVDEQRAKEF